jgi:hypothetical protein
VLKLSISGYISCILDFAIPSSPKVLVKHVALLLSIQELIGSKLEPAVIITIFVVFLKLSMSIKGHFFLN